MLPWQLAHTLMCVQTLAIVALYLLGCLPQGRGLCLLSFLAALGAVMAAHCGGNAMFFWNSNFAQSAIAALLHCMSAALQPLSTALSMHPWTASAAPPRASCTFSVTWRSSSACGGVCVGALNVLSFRMRRNTFASSCAHASALIKDFSTLDEALSVRQYLSDSVYGYLPENITTSQTTV